MSKKVPGQTIGDSRLTDQKKTECANLAPVIAIRIMSHSSSKLKTSSMGSSNTRATSWASLSDGT